MFSAHTAMPNLCNAVASRIYKQSRRAYARKHESGAHDVHPGQGPKLRHDAYLMLGIKTKMTWIDDMRGQAYAEKA